MRRDAVVAQPEHNAGVLHLARLGEGQPAPDDAHVGPLTQSDHAREPLLLKRLRVVVDETDELRVAVFGGEVADGRKIELVVPAQDPYPMLTLVGDRLEPFECVWIAALVVDDQDLVILVTRLLEQALNAGREVFQFVTRGNDDRHRRLGCQSPADQAHPRDDALSDRGPHGRPLKMRGHRRIVHRRICIGADRFDRKSQDRLGDVADRLVADALPGA